MKKFRIWDKHTKRFLDSRRFINRQSLIISSWDTEIFSLNENRYHFLESTGVKAKNGREIFVGDVVVSKKREFEGVVEYIQIDDNYPTFVYGVRANGKWNRIDFIGLGDIEIVGNIYDANIFKGEVAKEYEKNR